MATPFSQSGQAPLRLVTVLSISADGTTALCADKSGNQVAVPLMYQKAKGILPLVGEQWAVSNATGIWLFDTFYGTSAAQFDGGGGSSGGSGYAQSVYAYEGTPAKNNLPVAYVSETGQDPFGNTLGYTASFGKPSAFAIDNLGNATMLSPTGPVAQFSPSGSNPGVNLFKIPFLVYNGLPASGNLILSLSGTGGTDAYGNAYPKGFYATAGSVPANLISGQIPGSSNPVGAGTSINYNPYISGGDLTGWAPTGGTMKAVQQPQGPYPWGIQLVSGSTGPVYVSQPAYPVKVTQNTPYQVSGWADIAAIGPQALLGIQWLSTQNPNSSVGISTADVTVTGNTWTPVSQVFTSPPGANYAFPIMGAASSTGPGMQSFFQGILLLPQVPGGLIQVGTITAAQLAAGIIYAGIVDGTTIEAAQFLVDGGGPSNGIFVYSSTPGSGNLIGSWSTQPGTDSFGNPYPVGINATQGVLRGVNLINPTLTGAVVNVGTMYGNIHQGSTVSGSTVIESDIVIDSVGGAVLVYSTTSSVTTFSTGGSYTWTSPATGCPPSADISCWGAGAGGDGGHSGNAGPGGGAGEYAEETAYPITANTTYNVIVGNGGNPGSTNGLGSNGGQTSFNGSSGVVANGGQAGTATTGGPGGTGSTNTIAEPGGKGGDNTGGTDGGGGGGGSGGSTGPGGAGGNSTSATGAAGGIAGTPNGAAGGSGGNSGANGNSGLAPGGGGGGAGTATAPSSQSITYKPVQTYSYSGMDASTYGGSNGALRSTGTTMWQGGETASGGGIYGTQYAYAQYDTSLIQSDWAGYTMSGVTIEFVNEHSWYNSGMYIQLYQTSAAPNGASYHNDGSDANVVSWGADWINEGATASYSAGSSFANHWQNGTAVSIRIGPGPAFNLNYYGYFKGYGTGSAPALTLSGTIGSTVTAGAGADGQVTISYTTGAALIGSWSGTAFTDQYGNNVPVGFYLPAMAAAPAAPASAGSVLFGAPVSGYPASVAHTDGYVYNLGRRIWVVNSNQTFNSSSLVSVTFQPGSVSSINVAPVTYFIHGHLLASVANNPQLTMQFNTTASASYAALWVITSSISNVTDVAENYIPEYGQSVNQTFTLANGYTTPHVAFEGIIKFTTSGTFSLQLGVVSTGSWTLSQGCFMVMEPVSDV